MAMERRFDSTDVREKTKKKGVALYFAGNAGFGTGK